MTTIPITPETPGTAPETPINPVTPPETPGAPAPTPDTGTDSPPPIFEGLPKDIQAIPAIQWISIGKPPGFRVGPQEYFPELRPLVKHIGELIKNGLGLYGAQNGDKVLFNPLFIGPAEIETADKQGKLASILPDYGELTGQKPLVVDEATNTQRAADTADAQRQLADLTAPPAAGTAPLTPTATLPRQVPPSKSLTTSRLKGLLPGGPASGPAPGGGRILNALMTPAR